MNNNGITVFNSDEIGKVQSIEKSRSSIYMGFVYILEWDDLVKIGCTNQPYKRLRGLKSQAEKYGNTKLGRFALSKEHTNYQENEKLMHKLFEDFRKEGTELFNISIEKAVEKFSESVELLDESEKKEAYDKEVFEYLMSLPKLAYERLEQKKAENVNVEKLNVTSPVKKDDGTKRSVIDGVTPSYPTKRKGEYRMQRNNIEWLKDNLEDYLNSVGIDTSKKSMNCPICGDKGGFGFTSQSSRLYWHCFSAKHSRYDKDSGDIFTLVQQMENTDFKGALNILNNRYRLGIDVQQEVRKPRTYTPPQPTQEELKYKAFEKEQVKIILEESQRHLEDCDYVTKRGISIKTQKQYNIGYMPNFVHPKTLWKHHNEKNYKPYTTPRMIIPTSSTTLLARAVNEADEGKKGEYKALKVGNVHIFNADGLNCAERDLVGSKFCYIVEGELDALSAIDCGYNAIGLGSTSMIDKLFTSAEVRNNVDINPDVIWILALDNDEGGRTATTKLVELCRQYKQPYILADSNYLYDGAKDCNQALQMEDGRVKLTDRLQKYFEEVQKFNKAKFLEECEQMEKKRQEEQKALEESNTPNWVIQTKTGKTQINEPIYIKKVIDEINIKTINGTMLTPDGEMPIDALKHRVQDDIEPYTITGLATKTKNLVTAIQTKTYCKEIPLDKQNIHFANGTYNIAKKELDPNKVWCANRLAISYNPNAPKPTKWLKFLDELLKPMDIETLQEMCGYFLIPECCLQTITFIIGDGDEGKSIVGSVLTALLGSDNVCTDKLHEIQENRFKLANCENKLLFIDDDTSLGALRETSMLKTYANGGEMAIERKGKQATKANIYSRAICFGNGTLASLYDKSHGFFRRQLILRAKPVPKDRVKNLQLKEEIIADELEGILLWCLDGLNRLIADNYVLTKSPDAEKEIEESEAKANNFFEFLKDENLVEFDPNYNATSVEIFNLYKQWYEENALQPSVTDKKFVKEHVERLARTEHLNVKYSKKLVRKYAPSNLRGFWGIHLKATPGGYRDESDHRS